MVWATIQKLPNSAHAFIDQIVAVVINSITDLHHRWIDQIIGVITILVFSPVLSGICCLAVVSACDGFGSSLRRCRAAPGTKVPMVSEDH